MLPCVPTHAYGDLRISGPQPTKLHNELHRTHEVGHSAPMKRCSHASQLTPSASTTVLCLHAHSYDHLFCLPQEWGIIAWLNWSFPAYTLRLPSNCVLQTAFKKFWLNNWRHLTLTRWDFSNTSSDISALWAHGGSSLDVNKVNHMLASLRRAHLTGLLTRTFSRPPLFFPPERGIIAWLNWSFPHTPCSFHLSVSCRLLSRDFV